MSHQIFSFNCSIKNKSGSVISSDTKDEVLNLIEPETSMLNGLSKGLQN